MKKHIRKNKRTRIVLAIVLIIAAIGGTVMATTLGLPGSSKASRANTAAKVDNQTSNGLKPTVTNKNSSATLSNQASTSAATNTSSPAAKSATFAATEAAPVTVTVTDFQQLPVDDLGSIDCKLTYSDGTYYQWHWKVVNPQGTWSEDGQGQNGYWAPSTSVLNKCDTSVVGTEKAN